MTVSTAPTPLSYAGNGSTTAFPITWKYNSTTHVVATLRSSAGAETVWVVTTNYTITAAGDSGTLTAVVAPATGETLVITLEPPNTQSSDIPLGGDFPSTTVEDGLDLSAQRDAKIEALFLRALRVPKTDTRTGSNLELPIDTARASKFLAFDSDGDPIAAAGTSANLGPVSAFIDTLLDDTTAAAARATLGAAGLTDNNTFTGRLQSSQFNGARYGNIWSHNATDVSNDWDITAGGCMDSTQAYWIKTSALIKQADVAWAVGTNAGMLDTGAVGDSDYYIWAIARSDTGVTDYLSSLSSTAPTMPANYDYKRLIGWFKRLAGVNTLMDVYETEGGGVEVALRTTILNVNGTLGSVRRTDAVSVPLNFSVIANINVFVADATAETHAKIMCPDVSDVAITIASANITNQVANLYISQNMRIRTSSTGTIAARAESAVDSYRISTNGFSWARRN